MIGQTVSHYKILEKLGEGGMGVVYKAHDTKLNRHVALKFLPPDLTRDPRAKERFTAEARAASTLDHSNILTIHDIDESDDGRLFIAMACYEGETLDKKIERGPMEMDEAVDVIRQVSRGLTKAHEKGIVHRDIKPANIMITDEGVAKIVDFGLAKLTGQVRLTKTGTFVGTAAYMSPEQVRGEEVDHRTDVWSLGVVLYEMITGQRPFRGEHEQAVLYSILNQEPKSATDSRADLPGVVDRVLGKALEKVAGKRYQSSAELISDLDLDGVESAVGSRASTGGTSFRARNLLWIIPAVIIVGITGYFLKSKYISPQTIFGDEESIGSLVVLPLENLSGDPSQDFFADGMTEALISDVAKIKSLRVISRTSAMRYQNTEKTLADIAGELKVDAVVTGTVYQDKDQIRITAQLIHARNDEHLWNDTYERDLRDVLSVQREVARAIAGAIKIELTPQEEHALANTHQVHPDAHQAYLRGRYHWNKRTKEGLEKSIVFFEQAIQIEPNYALAHAGLADAHVVLGDWGYVEPKESYPKAKQIADKALSIDANLAEAISVLAAVAYEYDWDWKEAEVQFQRAISINPSYATAHQWYAEFLSAMGRFDEALAEIDKAQKLDPLALMAGSSKGWIFYFARRFDEAIEQSRIILEMDREFVHSYLVLALSTRRKGMHDEYVDALSNSLSIFGADEEVIAELNQLYETSGVNAAHEWMATKGFHYTRQTYSLPYYQAATYAELGNIDKAFELLEQGYSMRSHYCTRIGVDPDFDPLRSDPRFADLLKRVGLEH